MDFGKPILFVACLFLSNLVIVSSCNWVMHTIYPLVEGECSFDEHYGVSYMALCSNNGKKGSIATFNDQSCSSSNLINITESYAFNCSKINSDDDIRNPDCDQMILGLNYYYNSTTCNQTHGPDAVGAYYLAKLDNECIEFYGLGLGITLTSSKMIVKLYLDDTCGGDDVYALNLTGNCSAPDEYSGDGNYASVVYSFSEGGGDYVSVINEDNGEIIGSYVFDSHDYYQSRVIFTPYYPDNNDTSTSSVIYLCWAFELTYYIAYPDSSRALVVTEFIYDPNSLINPLFTNSSLEDDDEWVKLPNYSVNVNWRSWMDKECGVYFHYQQLSRKINVNVNVSWPYSSYQRDSETPVGGGPEFIGAWIIQNRGSVDSRDMQSALPTNLDVNVNILNPDNIVHNYDDFEILHSYITVMSFYNSTAGGYENVAVNVASSDVIIHSMWLGHQWISALNNVTTTVDTDDGVTLLIDDYAKMSTNESMYLKNPRFGVNGIKGDYLIKLNESDVSNTPYIVTTYFSDESGIVTEYSKESQSWEEHSFVKDTENICIGVEREDGCNAQAITFSKCCIGEGVLERAKTIIFYLGGSQGASFVAVFVSFLLEILPKKLCPCLKKRKHCVSWIQMSLLFFTLICDGFSVGYVFISDWRSILDDWITFGCFTKSSTLVLSEAQGLLQQILLLGLLQVVLDVLELLLQVADSRVSKLAKKFSVGTSNNSDGLYAMNEIIMTDAEKIESTNERIVVEDGGGALGEKSFNWCDQSLITIRKASKILFSFVNTTMTGVNFGAFVVQLVVSMDTISKKDQCFEYL